MPRTIIVKEFDITKQNLHGLKPEQYLSLMEHQNFKCCVSGNEFKYSKEKQKFIEENLSNEESLEKNIDAADANETNKNKKKYPIKRYINNC